MPVRPGRRFRISNEEGATDLRGHSEPRQELRHGSRQVGGTDDAPGRIGDRIEHRVAARRTMPLQSACGR